MTKTIIGVVAGVLSWGVLITLGGVIVRATWPSYVAVAESMAFTLPMLFARLAMSTAALLLAGALTRILAPQAMAATMLLGLVLLVGFIPIHISLWDKFPVWYHLFFLLTLIPFGMAGGRLGSALLSGWSYSPKGRRIAAH
jgi:hypothetical protein